EQQDVEAARAQVLERLGRVACNRRLDAVLAEELDKQGGELAIVFDEKRLAHHSLGPPNPPLFCWCFWCISFALSASFCRCADVSTLCTFTISGTITCARSWTSFAC